MALGAIALIAGSAEADPKFKYGKSDEVKDVKKAEWKASAQAGLVMTTGNSETTTLSGAAKASRKEGNNKLVLEAGGIYARSTIFLALDGNSNGVIDPGEIGENETTASKAWMFKARYDRFLTKHNSLYVTGQVNGDQPAGKQFVGGGQVGYSRQLYKDDKHEVVGEAGYDFSYEDLAAGDPVSIHSMRYFAGYEGKLTKDTGLIANSELLLNVNSLDTPTGPVDAFGDVRYNGTVGLTTKLLKNISFKFAFSTKYDRAPAPRPKVGGIDYAMGFQPKARRLDTKTEASLIINFL
jgi:hypothetical protein